MVPQEGMGSQDDCYCLAPQPVSIPSTFGTMEIQFRVAWAGIGSFLEHSDTAQFKAGIRDRSA
jgi:hypothetical protein